jgi:hypothetical protein
MVQTSDSSQAMQCSFIRVAVFRAAWRLGWRTRLGRLCRRLRVSLLLAMGHGASTHIVLCRR